MYLLLAELDALGDVLLELSNAVLEEVLLEVGDVTDGEDLLNTVLSELDAGGEEGDGGLDGGLDEGALNDALIAAEGLKEGEGELGTSEGHGEGGGAGSVLSLDDLVSSVLDALGEGGDLLLVQAANDAGLGEEGDDGGTAVASDNGDVEVEGVHVELLGDEGLGADDVKGGDTEEATGIEDASLAEDLSGDGNGGVHGVADDGDAGLGADLGALGDEVLDNGGVGVEEVITGHSGLAGDSGGDDDDVSSVEGLGELVLGVSSDLGGGGDVAEISGDSGGVHDIVAAEG